MEEIDLLGGSAVTIGVFDGVHLGHQRLVSKLQDTAKRRGLASVVLTFRNHPASVLRSGFEPRYLTTPGERERLLEEAGVDRVVQATFDLELSTLGARTFAGMLQESLGMRALVAGPDFAMGRSREGDARTLARLGEDMGFALEIVKPLAGPSGEIVRSTSVRAAISEGEMDRAASLLGRPYSIAGQVVKGHGRGGPLGFPTANILPPADILPPRDGIYAAWIVIDGVRRISACSIGERPTFPGAGRAIEAFVMDFQGDLYGKELRLEFVRRLRDEARYDDVGQLQAQVDADIAETRRILGGQP